MRDADRGPLVVAPPTQPPVLGGELGVPGVGAAWAASTRTARSHLEPLRVRPKWYLPADSLLPGHSPAQEARWTAEGN